MSDSKWNRGWFATLTNRDRINPASSKALDTQVLQDLLNLQNPAMRHSTGVAPLYSVDGKTPVGSAVERCLTVDLAENGVAPTGQPFFCLFETQSAALHACAARVAKFWSHAGFEPQRVSVELHVCTLNNKASLITSTHKHVKTLLAQRTGLFQSEYPDGIWLKGEDKEDTGDLRLMVLRSALIASTQCDRMLSLHPSNDGPAEFFDYRAGRWLSV